jgi:hypothetical protein
MVNIRECLMGKCRIDEWVWEYLKWGMMRYNDGWSIFDGCGNKNGDVYRKWFNMDK